MSRVLARAGYSAAPTQEQLLVEMLRAGENVNLLITNRPEPFLPFEDRLPVLYLSTFPDPVLAARFRICRTLAKPFHPDALVGLVKVLLRESDLGAGA